MDLDPGLLLLLLWGVLSIFGGLARKKQQRREGTGQRRQPPVEQRPRTTQQPETFDDLLADMREQLARAGGADAGRERDPEPLTWAEEVEETESLEVEPVVVSLEVPARIDERVVVDPNIEMQRVIDQRLRDAERRNRAWRLEDHRAFDARIRAPVEEAALPPHRVRDLRRAVVWREILGKPVSMRGS
jgi:hypothetical protein